MLIKGKNLRLYYWEFTQNNFFIHLHDEVKKELYGYNLEPGQIIHAARYSETNLELAFDFEVLDVSEEGILVQRGYHSKDFPHRKSYERKNPIWMPWEKDFPEPYDKTRNRRSYLYIEPCEMLYEYNPLADLIAGTAPVANYLPMSGKVNPDIGKGLWEDHGKRTTVSDHEGNLKNFVRLGQLKLF